MGEEACLVTTGTASAEDEKLARLIEFFGVDFVWIEPNEFNSRLLGDGARVLCSATAYAGIKGELQADRIHSVFVYADTSAERKTARRWKIATDPIAGAMAGLEVESEAQVVAWQADGECAVIIASGETPAFVRCKSRGVPVYHSLGKELIDIDAELTTPNFDVRDHFLSAVPIVMYLRWGFPTTAWRPAETGACLIIDDPLLRPRYGFIRFRELLGLMEEHNFSTTVAFIPWNSDRNQPETVRLFRENPGRLSIAVHGCDHTASEFGSEDPQRLRQLVNTATTRMLTHEQATGLRHDRVMVFPQGVFSSAAIAELKRGGFSAVANTEVKAVGGDAPQLTIGDVWDVALMRYSEFPIFTRRYPRQGVENLAFDVLLGKPCLIVIHHDFCSDHYTRLIEFIQQVNALQAPLVWRSLGEVLARSSRQRATRDGQVEVQRYARDASFSNEMQPVEGLNGQLTTHGLKARLRRYLSEARDNYVMPAKARLARRSR